MPCRVFDRSGQFSVIISGKNENAGARNDLGLESHPDAGDDQAGFLFECNVVQLRGIFVAGRQTFHDVSTGKSRFRCHSELLSRLFDQSLISHSTKWADVNTLERDRHCCHSNGARRSMVKKLQDHVLNSRIGYQVLMANVHKASLGQRLESIGESRGLHGHVLIPVFEQFVCGESEAIGGIGIENKAQFTI